MADAPAVGKRQRKPNLRCAGLVSETPPSKQAKRTSSAAAATAVQSPQTADPDMQISHMVEEPQGQPLLTTPSDGSHSKADLLQRTVETPGSEPFTTFYTGEEQVQQQAPSQQLAGELSTQLPPEVLALLQQQQQQFNQQQQQLQNQLQTQQSELQALREQIAAVQQAPGRPGAAQAGDQPVVAATQVPSLQQEIALLKRQVQFLVQQQQQHTAQGGAMLQASVSLMQSMVADPFAFMQPNMSTIPAVPAALVPAGIGSVAPSHMPNVAAVLAAGLAQIETRVTDRVTRLEDLMQQVLAAVQGNTSNGEAPPAEAAAAAAPDTQAAGCNDTSAGGPSSSAAAAAAAAAALSQDGQAAAPAGPSHQKSSKAVKEKIGFPDLGTHTSLVHLAEWWAATPLLGTGKTPQQLEAEAERSRDWSWRGGKGHRKQRWSEYVELLTAIGQEQTRLTAEQHSSARLPHLVVPVDEVTAAASLDQQRAALGLSVSQYRAHLAKTKSSRLAAEDEERGAGQGEQQGEEQGEE